MSYVEKECRKDHIYIAIDLKSFYASVECQENDMDPLTTNLVVADASRTEKTICLAVSPALKAYGIPGRARLFEVVQRVKEINEERRRRAPGHRFTGKSTDAGELKKHPEFELAYVTAPPRMALYMDYSTRVYNVYLKYAAPEDIHVYSIDEVFIDVTEYLKTAGLTPKEFAGKIIRNVFDETGITAAAGIGTNLYLCKVAMDIVAKHTAPDNNGVRIAELDERSYRELLWSHRPLTDFWRVGRGYAKKLEQAGLFTMGDIARCSLGKDTDFYNEDFLYKMFGINAELLIDHAWGYEPCTIADIKAYRPADNSIGSGQVLQCPYSASKARLIVQEMTDLLVLDLVDKELVTDQLVLTVGYDIENLSDKKIRESYRGEVKTDRFGRQIPKHAHGTVNLKKKTSSTKIIMEAMLGLYDRIVDPGLLVRRIYVTATHVIDEKEAAQEVQYEQLELFADYGGTFGENDTDRLKSGNTGANTGADEEPEESFLEKEKKLQKAVLDIKKKYGKNAVLKGMNLEEGAMTRERNRQIGGHKA